MRPGLVNRLDMVENSSSTTGMKPGENGTGVLQKMIFKTINGGNYRARAVRSDGTVLLFSDKTFPDGSYCKRLHRYNRAKKEKNYLRLSDGINSKSNGDVLG